LIATYNFVCIPLDSGAAKQHEKTFAMKLVSELQFKMGVPISPADIRDAVSQHPVLNLPANRPLSAFVWDYNHWHANRNSLDKKSAIKVQMAFAGKPPLKECLHSTMDYLGAGNEAVTPGALQHDGSYEQFTDEHYVNVGKAGDDLQQVNSFLQSAAVSNLASVVGDLRNRTELTEYDRTLLEGAATLTNFETASFRLARWINSGLTALLIHALTEPEAKSTFLYPAFNPQQLTVLNLRNALAKIDRRMTRSTAPDCGATQLTAVVPKGKPPQQVQLSDPNVAIHAALKNALVAERLGFVTSWEVTASVPMLSGDFVIEIDTDSLVYDHTKVEVLEALPTAFRRGNHTHPLAYVDIGKTTGNCALAFLNDESGAPRYRASSINSEQHVVKQVLLQARNSLAGVEGLGKDPQFGGFNAKLDDRSPQLLQDQQFGNPEPETSGLIFSAPTEDLRQPSDLRVFESPESRRAGLPCLFLEDLWIGYRLDLKNNSRTKFTSTHAQTQLVTFSASKARITGETEDYIEREQADDPDVGHTSTELKTYTGFNLGQAQDCRIILGTDKQTVVQPQQPFQVALTDYGTTEALIFTTLYDYRFRNVFRGCVSCDVDDDELLAERFDSHYRQSAPFFRAAALRAGEILANEDTDPKGKDLPGDLTFYLSSDHPELELCLVPSPINFDSARFHGLLFRDKRESKELKGRQFVTDLGKFFKSIPPSKLDYFYDPDVYGVTIRVTMVNGDKRREPEFSYIDKSYCRLSQQIQTKSIALTYGKPGEWRSFEAITISLQITSDPLPSLVRKDDHTAEVRVPPAGEIHISLLPLFDPSLKSRTASHIHSSTQLFLADKRKKAGQETNDTIPIPAVAEEIVKVIHAVNLPLDAPALNCERPRFRAEKDIVEQPCLGTRALDSEMGEVVGRIEVDAASAKEVRLEAKWVDIQDGPDQERYALTGGNASSTPRSLMFRQFTPPQPSAAEAHDFFLSPKSAPHALMKYKVGKTSYGFIDQFLLQCAEDKIFLGVTEGDDQTDAVKSIGRLNLKDQRRKLISVQAVAVGRFGDRFPKDHTHEKSSKPLLIDIPSTARMSPPVISHVVPLKSNRTLSDGSSTVQSASFGVRVYVRKPFFESGFGERLAVGCVAGDLASNIADGDRPKYISQWGEDPIERAELPSTLRLPRATDFGVPSMLVDLAADLYPADVVGSQNAVIYQDNIALPQSDPKLEAPFVSVASYAVRYDTRQQLWYADIALENEFFGWCGLAVYRHQPHALLGRELSGKAAWIYAAILYGEPVTWVEKGEMLHITIGPVYDRYISFQLESHEFVDGVSNDLAKGNVTQHDLQRYRVDNSFYFEAFVPKRGFDWSLIKKRFDMPMASSARPR